MKDNTKEISFILDEFHFFPSIPLNSPQFKHFLYIV